MNLFIHVGYPKTATTWLQRIVLPQHECIDYWHFDDPEHAWIQEIVRVHDFDFDPDKFRQQYQQRVLRRGTRSIVGISWESFSGDPFAGAEDNCRNASRLQSIFPNAKILIGIRNQIDMINSLYKQYIMEGGAVNLKDFLNLKFPNRVRFDLDSLRYDRLISHYMDLFGKDSVFICLYEELREHPQLFLDNVFSFLGVPTLTLGEETLTRRVNEGLSYPSLVVSRFINRFLYSHFNPSPIVPRVICSAKMVRYASQRIADPLLFSYVCSDQSFIHDAMRSKLGNFYGASNKMLMEKFDLAVDKYGYPIR